MKSPAILSEVGLSLWHLGIRNQEAFRRSTDNGADCWFKTKTLYHVQITWGLWTTSQNLLKENQSSFTIGRSLKEMLIMENDRCLVAKGQRQGKVRYYQDTIGKNDPQIDNVAQILWSSTVNKPCKIDRPRRISYGVEEKRFFLNLMRYLLSNVWSPLALYSLKYFSSCNGFPSIKNLNNFSKFIKKSSQNFIIERSLTERKIMHANYAYFIWKRSWGKVWFYSHNENATPLIFNKRNSTYEKASEFPLLSPLTIFFWCTSNINL